MTTTHTPRLTLRPFRAADADALQVSAGVPAVARMTSDIPHPLTLADAQAWLEPQWGEQRFAICRDQALIGGAGTFRRDSGAGELGFWLGQEHWGRGYATEAASAVIAYGVATRAYSGFSSSHFDDNPASRRVLEKLGFEPAGTGRIWSAARQQTVAAHWYWLSLEKATALHGTAIGANAVSSTPERPGRWARFADRLHGALAMLGPRPDTTRR